MGWRGRVVGVAPAVVLAVAVGGVPPSAQAQNPVPPIPGNTDTISAGEFLPWTTRQFIADEFLDLRLELEDAVDGWVDDLEDWASDLDGQDVELSGITCIARFAGPHAVAYAAGLADLEPISDYALSTAVFELNLALKLCEPIAVAPPPLTFEVGEDECEVRIEDQRKHQNLNFVFTPPALPGLSLDEGVVPSSQYREIRSAGLLVDYPDSSWGRIGTPLYAHYNTGVKGWLQSISNGSHGRSFSFDPEIDVEQPRARDLLIPVGRNTATWKFQSLLGPLDWIFIYVPPAPCCNKGPTLWQAAGHLARFGLPVLGLFLNTDPVFGTQVTLTQDISVWDRVPPVIETTQEEFTFEGTIFGGTSIQVETYRQQLMDALVYSDECDNEVTIVEPNPTLWPVDERTPVTWTALDPGPNDMSPRSDQRNEASVVQYVTVVDTIAPTVRTPDPISLEVAAGSTGPFSVETAAPQIFDFVDQEPQVENDAPPGDLFPIGKTAVTWTVTDQSGNQSTASQIVNIKEEGANAVPTASARTGAAAIEAPSFTEVAISLVGSDPDGDPLSFRVTDPPENGFFVAPLLPFFFGDARAEVVVGSQCIDDGRGPADLFAPEYVTTSDEGLTYILNASGECVGSPAFWGHRITVLDRDRNLVAYRDLPRVSSFFRAFHLDAKDGFLVYPLRNGVLKLDLQTLETLEAYHTPESIVHKAVFDRREGREVLYVTGRDDQNVGRFDVYDVTGATPDEGTGEIELGLDRRVGSIAVGEQGPPGRLYNVLDLAVDSLGHLYVSSLDRRIHKFAPFRTEAIDPQDDAAGRGVLPGDEIGWMGACIGGSACDVANQRSRGYTCRFDTCDVQGVMPSEGFGQLGALGGMAIDPNDILYVAEFGNMRVQRFTPAGFYAGHARSSCDSDELCFVLGEFGRPNAVGVNSTNFFVLDTVLDVVHIFDTSVVELVAPNEARVTYKSKSGFFREPGQGIDPGLDRFEFVVSDGFDESAPAAVEIDVRRGQHPAVAVDGKRVSVVEDTPTDVRLDAADPDFPLDPFAFTVLEEPMHGALSPKPGGDSGDWIYTPDPDFVGEDQLRFRVDDGSGPSDAATLFLTVTQVNDLPTIVAVEGAGEAGLGYPYPFFFRFDDVEIEEQGMFSQIRWGDGSVDRFGDVPLAEVGLFAAPRPGIVTTSHVYLQPGVQTIDYCIGDQIDPEVCEMRPVSVVPMADFVVSIEDTNTPVPVGGEVEFEFVVAHRPTEGGVGPTSTDDIELEVFAAAGLRALEATPDRGNCELDTGAGERLIVCDLGSGPVGETLVVRARFAVEGASPELRANVGSAFPDPNGAVAVATVETLTEAQARTAALSGTSAGGMVHLKVAGLSLEVAIAPGTDGRDAARAIAEAIEADPALANVGVTANYDGPILEVSEPLESLRLDEGGLTRGREIRFVNGRLRLDLDSLGVHEGDGVSGVAYLDETGRLTLPAQSFAPFSSAAANAGGPPEIESVEFFETTNRSGAIGAEGSFELRLSGLLALVFTGGGGETLPLSVIGANDLERNGDYALRGEPWSTESFEIDAWTAEDGILSTRSFAGGDERDAFGDGALTLVTPVPIEIYDGIALVEVVPGAAELRVEVIPEPGTRIGAGLCLALLWGAARRARRGVSSEG